MEHLRRNWDALRQGEVEFSPAGASNPSPGAAREEGTKDGESTLDAEEAAWRALAETRRMQSPAARAAELIRESRFAPVESEHAYHPPSQAKWLSVSVGM